MPRKSVSKNPIGRPYRTLTDEEYRDIEEWVRYGITIQEICENLDIPCRNTFYAMMERDEKLKKMVMQGRTRKKVTLMKMLEEIALGQSKGNPTGAIFMLKALGCSETQGDVLKEEARERTGQKEDQLMKIIIERATKDT